MTITLDGTTGITSPNDTTGNQSYTGTLTGGTGIVNLGSGQFYKDASGNVGIGTSTPYGRLRVKANSTAFAGGLSVQRSDTLDTYELTVGADNSLYLGYAANASGADAAGDFTVRAVIDSSGNLGIGTSSPAYTLDVNGQAQSKGLRLGYQTALYNVDSTLSSYASDNWVYLNGNAGGGLQLRGDGTGNQQINLQGGASSYININTAGTERMRIDSSGNVGVGTASPTCKFQVINPDASWSTTGSMTSGSSFGHNVGGTALNIGGSTGITWIQSAYANNAGVSVPLAFVTGGTERMRIDSSGYLLVNRTTTIGTTRVSIEGDIASTSGSNFVKVQADGIYRQYSSTNGAGFHLTGNAIFPSNYNGAIVDNQIAFGGGGQRWTVIYAVSGTINTSDGNEKQNIESLSEAELRVAKKLTRLIRKFKFKDAVAAKGDGARIHVGVIAQDVEAAFVSEGLDAHQYGMFCEDSWYTVDGKPTPKPENPYTADTPNAVKFTRKGIRYDELLAFVIAAQSI